MAGVGLRTAEGDRPRACATASALARSSALTTKTWEVLSVDVAASAGARVSYPKAASFFWKYSAAWRVVYPLSTRTVTNLAGTVLVVLEVEEDDVGVVVVVVVLTTAAVLELVEDACVGTPPIRTSTTTPTTTATTTIATARRGLKPIGAPVGPVGELAEVTGYAHG